MDCSCYELCLSIFQFTTSFIGHLSQELLDKIHGLPFLHIVLSDVTGSQEFVNFSAMFIIASTTDKHIEVDRLAKLHSCSLPLLITGS